MKHEENLNYSLADLKEKAKRDTNDFLREAGSAADEFEKLMSEARSFYEVLIERLPEKSSPSFEGELKNIFEVARSATTYVREDILQRVAAKADLKLAFLKKEFNKENVIARSNASGDVRLGAALIQFYSTEKGISNQPQAPLSSVVEVVLERLFTAGYEFYLDLSSRQLFMRDENSKLIVIDSRDKEFAEWAFKVLELSSVNREPVKDIVAGIGVALMADERVLKFESLKFNDLVRNEGKCCAIFHVGPGEQNLILVRPSEDKTTPQVEVVPNFDNAMGVGLLPPPMQSAPIRYLGIAETINGMMKIKTIFFDSQPLKSDDKLRSFCHKFQGLLPGKCRRKMRKGNRGEPGAGKTTDGDLFSQFVYGAPVAGAFGDEKELWHCAHMNPIQVIDNWEGVAKKEQAEFARLHATGGSKTFRKLYSDAQMITYSPNSHIVESAVEGFTQGEDAAREQIYLYDEKYMDPAFSILDIEEELHINRDLMWSAFFNALSVHILPEYDNLLRRYERHLKSMIHSKRRFNDFIARQALIVDLVRPYWGISESTFEILDKWMSLWTSEDAAVAGELDPIVQRLEIIFTEERFNVIGSSSGGLGAVRALLSEGLTSTRLHSILCQVEKEFGLPRAYHSPSILAQRLRISVKVWNESYGSHRIRKEHKVMIYSFKYGKADLNKPGSTDLSEGKQ